MSSNATAAQEGQLQKVVDRIDTLGGFLQKAEPHLKASLAGSIDSQAFIRYAMTTLQVTPGLAQCTIKSFVGAVMEAAQLMLPPDNQLGWAYILPYKNKGKWEAQFQLGYKGIKTLMYRSGQVAAVRANVVREGDQFEWLDGLVPLLTHAPGGNPEAPIMSAWAVVDTRHGGHIPWVMTVDQIEKIKQRSQAAKSGYGPWMNADDYPWMAMKTCIKQAGKLAPLEYALQRAINLDDLAEANLPQDLGQDLDVSFTVPGEEADEEKTDSEAFEDAYAGDVEGDPMVRRIKALAEAAGMTPEDLEELVHKEAGGPLDGMPDDREEMVTAAIKKVAIAKKKKKS